MSDTRPVPIAVLRGGLILPLIPALASLLLMWGTAARAGPAWWLVWGAALLVCLGAVGAAWHGALSAGEAAMVAAGALASATAAFGLLPWHYFTKPAVVVIAIYVVAISACHTGAGYQFRSNISALWLIGALLGSLAGDVFLMWGGWFTAGLVSFLLAHLCYIVLFARGAPWLALRPARVACLSAGVVMYVFLWRGGLPVELRVPVAVYVLAIAVMAAQAWTRWQVRRDAPALAVALGACCFMLSDSLLATDRFVQALPWAPLWVLATYYAAQVLIVIGVVRSLR